jgi:hypothetical protein
VDAALSACTGMFIALLIHVSGRPFIILITSSTVASLDDAVLRRIIDELFDQQGDKRQDLIQILLRELFVAVYSKKDVRDGRFSMNLSPALNSVQGQDYLLGDDVGSDDNNEAGAGGDHQQFGTGKMGMPRLPVTSASQITINKHNPPANRDISIPSRKVSDSVCVHIADQGCILSVDVSV